MCILNKYVVSIAPFSTSACPDCSRNITETENCSFCMFLLFNFSSIFPGQGHLPLCADAHVRTACTVRVCVCVDVGYLCWTRCLHVDQSVDCDHCAVDRSTLATHTHNLRTSAASASSSSLIATSLTATGTHTPYGITRCYQPPGRADIPAFAPAFFPLFGFLVPCLQCFDAVGWAAGRASGL